MAKGFLSKSSTVKHLGDLGIHVGDIEDVHTVASTTLQQMITALCAPGSSDYESRIKQDSDLTKSMQSATSCLRSMDSMTEHHTSMAEPIESFENLPWLQAVVNHENCLRTPMDFYDNFRDRFTIGYPTGPPFFIGRLQTALLRVMDVYRNRQKSPFLIYLHDDDAPGAVHFTANVLCSRRFTAKLFDHDLHIWPYDATGTFSEISKHETLVINEIAESIQSKTANLITSYEPLQQWPAKSHWNQKGLMRTGRVLHDKVDVPQETKTFGDLEVADSENKHEQSAFSYTTCKNLLRFFDNHLARNTIEKILQIPLLPTLVNLTYSEQSFTVTHILLPSATTKEAVSWLNGVLKTYQLNDIGV